jgi:hypothetical protein
VRPAAELKRYTEIMNIKITISVIIIICCLIGCSPAIKEVTNQKDTSPKTGEAFSPSSVFGKWKVVNHVSPGISAMTEAQADKWIGKEALYEQTKATFETETCANARYTVKVVDADNYLLDGFKVDAKAIGIKPRKLQIIEVTCGSSDWIAPGSLLIVKSKDRLVTFWDGVFFELAREGTV